MATNRIDEPLLSPLKRQMAGITAEAKAMLAARAELLGLELSAARKSVVQLVVAVLLGCLILLVALPMATVAFSQQLARWFSLDPLAVLWVFTLLMFLGGAGLIYGSWRRFRREFHGVEDSIAELQEDLQWMQEWLGTQPEDEASSGFGVTGAASPLDSSAAADDDA